MSKHASSDAQAVAAALLVNALAQIRNPQANSEQEARTCIDSWYHWALRTVEKAKPD